MIKHIRLIEPPAPDYHVFSFCDLPRLGLPILGAILKEKGYEVQISIPAGVRPSLADLLQADLVGISITTSTAPEGYRLADRLREMAKAHGKRLPVVFGGVHATFLPEEALTHGDYVIRHEGEESFPALIAALDGDGDLSAIPGLSYFDGDAVRHNPDGRPIENLDRIPCPDLTLIQGYKPRITPILASRGCPHHCTFCCVTEMMGRRYRRCSVDRVIDELRRAPTRSVFFYDDNFAADRAGTKALLRRMIDEGLDLRWSAQVRSDVAEDEELLALMRRAGGAILYIGFESANQEALTELHKGLAIAAVEDNIRIIKQHGFDIHGMFIFGADSDHPESLRRTLAFARRNKLDTVQFMTLTPLPGTPLFTRLGSEGRLLTTDWRRYDGANVVFRPARMTPYELQVLTYRALRKFYSWGLLLRYAARRQWAKAGVVAYARITLGKWYNRHRGWFEALKARSGQRTPT